MRRRRILASYSKAKISLLKDPYYEADKIHNCRLMR